MKKKNQIVLLVDSIKSYKKVVKKTSIKQPFDNQSIVDFV